MCVLIRLYFGLQTKTLYCCWWKNSVSGMYKTLISEPSTVWHGTSILLRSSLHVRCLSGKKARTVFCRCATSCCPNEFMLLGFLTFCRGTMWCRESINMTTKGGSFESTELMSCCFASCCGMLWLVFWCINHYEPKGGRFMYLDFCIMVRNGRCPNTSGRQIKLAV